MAPANPVATNANNALYSGLTAQQWALFNKASSMAGSNQLGPNGGGGGGVGGDRGPGGAGDNAWGAFYGSLSPQQQTLYDTGANPDATSIAKGPGGIDGFLNQAIPGLVGAGLAVLTGGAATPALGAIGGGAVAGAVGGASSAALTGGNVGKGALTGAIGGGVGGALAPVNSAVGEAVSNVAGDTVGDVAGDVTAGAIGGAVKSAVGGGSLVQGAVAGGVGGGVGGASGSSALGNVAGGVAARVVGNGGLGSPAAGTPSPSPLGSPGLSSTSSGNGNMATGQVNSGVALPGVTMQAGGVGNDFSAAPLLSAAGGLYQAYTGAQSAQKTSNNQQNAFTTASNAGNFGNFNFSSPTGTANMGGYGLSPGLTTAANQDASNAGTFGKLAAQYGSGGLPAGVQTSLNNVNSAYGADSTALNKLAGQVGTGMTGAMGLYGAGQGVMGAGAGYTNAAQGIIANQGTNFDQTYQTALKTQMDALKNPQQQQMSQLQDQEFGRGMLGTSGGALQTQAMATGFGQADIQAQSTAMNQALQQYGLGTQAASAYGNLGSNTLSIGGGLMNNALSTYGNLASLGGNLTNSIYNMASSNFGTNANASMLPGQLAGQYSNLAGSSTNQASTLNSMGLAQYNAGLTGQNDVNNAMQRSAATQGAISLNGNYSPGNSGYGNMVGQLLGQGTGGLNSPGGGLLGQAGHLVSNLFGGGGNGGGGNGGGVSYDPTAIDPGAGTSFSGTSAPGVDTSGVGNFDPSLYGIGG